MSTNQISFNACADSLTVSNTDTPSVDPAASFNFTGQLIILMLIQLGEIAYMTLVFFIMIAARHKITSFRVHMSRYAFALRCFYRYVILQCFYVDTHHNKIRTNVISTVRYHGCPVKMVLLKCCSRAVFVDTYSNRYTKIK
jgi:hypothetical protein